MSYRTSGDETIPQRCPGASERFCGQRPKHLVTRLGPSDCLTHHVIVVHGACPTTPRWHFYHLSLDQLSVNSILTVATARLRDTL